MSVAFFLYIFFACEHRYRAVRVLSVLDLVSHGAQTIFEVGNLMELVLGSNPRQCLIIYNLFRQRLVLHFGYLPIVETFIAEIGLSQPDIHMF